MDLESTKLLNYCKSGKKNVGSSSNNKDSDSNRNNIASTSNNKNYHKENQTNNSNSQHDIECSSSISCNSVSSTSKIYNSSNNNSTSSNSSSQYNNNNSTINSNKRKRRATLDDKDNELDNSTQQAKRLQIMPSSSAASSASKSSIISIASSTICYQNNNNHSDSHPGSVSSSYPGDDLPNEIDTRSCSSDCLSTVAEYDIGTPSPEDGQNIVLPLSDTSSLLASMCHEHGQYRPISIDNATKWKRISEGVRGDKTPHSEKQRYTKSFIEFAAERSLTPTIEVRACPLPALSWANSQDVWNAMCRKDELAAKERHSTMLENHPGLQPRMRAILLDWLIEVCEVYKLHRETYYLAVDYLDRYLSTQTKVQKTHLQLIGITCLFVAAKVEEIYPPKIGEFAYVTDGACQEEDIINYELLLLNALNWNISPVTIMGWLGIYMQLNASSRTAASFITSSKNNNSSNWNNGYSVNNKELGHNHNTNKNHNCSNLFKKVQDKNFINFKDINNVRKNFKDNSTNNNYNNCNNNNNDNAVASTSSANNNNTNLTVNDSGISITDGNTDDSFIYPQFSGFEFVQTAQIIDLCTLDLGLSDYPYSVIAAAAISHTFGRETAIRVSGYEWNYIAPCARWIEPFFQIVSEESQHLYLTEQNEQLQTKYGLGHICPNIVTDDSHIIQTHTTSMTMFDKALLRREQYQSSILAMIKQESSPAVTGSHHLYPEGLLTPPLSHRKPIDDENIENLPDLRIMNSSNIS